MNRISILLLIFLFSGCGFFEPITRKCLYLYRPADARSICVPYFLKDNDFFLLASYDISHKYKYKYPEHKNYILVYYSSYDNNIVIPLNQIYGIKKMPIESIKKQMIKNGTYEYKFLYTKNNNQYKPVLSLEEYNDIAIQECFDDGYCLSYPMATNGISYYVKRKHIIPKESCGDEDSCINDK
ncbi:hypothetical protein CSPB12327_08570 [Campylobacter sp. RM12327]|uniref:hypothetical protein n=1 Tax=Campylobacter sputorum TaxID=206 RepID=UPI0018969BF1|nr:hypothetical protein [Campylobacter sp. RM12327]MBF6670185.1 hypothetical protein [Campylobacter sp. RM12327]